MRKSSPSGELTYFAGIGSSSRSRRAWKPQIAPARIREGEDEAPVEVVVPSPVDEPGRGELLSRVPLFERPAGEHRAAGREPEAELAADLLAEAAALEVRTRRLACVALPQVALVEACRPLEQRSQPLAPAPALVVGGRSVLVLDCDAEAIGEPFDGLGEVELLGLTHERDRVAACAAAEAVVELVLRVDGEARRPLLVEGAAPGVATARSCGAACAHRPARPCRSRL